MSEKVHRSQGKLVPFSWEKKAGVAKEMTRNNSRIGGDIDECNQAKELSSLPLFSETIKDKNVQDTQLLPLPPCGLIPPQRSSFTWLPYSRKGIKKQDDPFFAAYKECTKDGNTRKLIGEKDDGGAFGISKNMSIFSCKHACSVRDDSMTVLNSKTLMKSKSHRERREVHKGSNVKL